MSNFRPGDQRLLILAGTAAQAGVYMREHNLMPSQIAYAMSEEQIRGYQNPEYVIIGTFWDRHDCIRMWQSLKKCMTDGRVMKAPDHIETFLEPVKKPIVPTPAPPVPEVKTEPLKPIKFKHIKVPKPVNGGFKHIKP
jgi:hypothetical protein